MTRLIANSLIKNFFLFPFRGFHSASINLDNPIINDIKLGQSILIAGEPADNCDFAYIGVIKSLLDKVKGKSKIEKKPINFFLNAEQAYNEIVNAKKDYINLKENTIAISPALDTEIQQYSFCKELDHERKLKIHRMGSSLELYVPFTNSDLYNMVTLL